MRPEWNAVGLIAVGCLGLGAPTRHPRATSINDQPAPARRQRRWGRRTGIQGQPDSSQPWGNIGEGWTKQQPSRMRYAAAGGSPEEARGERLRFETVDSAPTRRLLARLNLSLAALRHWHRRICTLVVAREIEASTSSLCIGLRCTPRSRSASISVVAFGVRCWRAAIRPSASPRPRWRPARRRSRSRRSGLARSICKNV